MRFSFSYINRLRRFRRFFEDQGVFVKCGFINRLRRCAYYAAALITPLRLLRRCAYCADFADLLKKWNYTWRGQLRAMNIV